MQKFLLSEGEHYITLKCFQDNLFSRYDFENTLKFVVKASQPMYFIASPSLKCGKIRLSNKIEAPKNIKRSKFINLENKAIQ